MNTVKIEMKERIAVLTLDSGVTNPVGSDLVDDLSAALNEIREDARGMVLAGGEKFFSIGLNLPELIQLDRGGMADFWRRFMNVTLDLYTLPMVTAAAIEGHAPAAGTVFAVACDYRFAAEGRRMIGLNEIKLGIPVPYLSDLMLRQLVGDRVATDLLYQGEFVMPERALELGVIDGVSPSGSVIDRALEKVTGIAPFHADSFAAIKNTRTEGIRVTYQQNAERVNTTLLDCWFSDSTRKLMEEAAEKF